jgi:hypothetical protein
VAVKNLIVVAVGAPAVVRTEREQVGPVKVVKPWPAGIGALPNLGP